MKETEGSHRVTYRVSRTLAAWAAAHLAPWRHKGHKGPCPPECTPWEGHEPAEDNYWQPRKSAITPGGDVGQKCSRRWGEAGILPCRGAECLAGEPGAGLGVRVGLSPPQAGTCALSIAWGSDLKADSDSGGPYVGAETLRF